MEIELAKLTYSTIEIFNYQRRTSQMLITSGCGLGLGLMDILPSVSYWFDLDTYRHELIDWETFGINIYFAGITHLILAGWATIDTPKSLMKIHKGFLGKKYFYLGGQKQTLQQFIDTVEKPIIVA